MTQSATAKRIVAGLAVLAATFCGTQTWATQFYLAPNGLDADGKGLSSSSPARTPQWLEQKNTVKAGDTVWMAGGTYASKDMLILKGGSSGNPVTYKPFTGQKPVISGADYIRAANVVVEDLTVVNSVAQSIDFDNAPNSILRRAHIYGSQSHGIRVQRSANARIEYAHVHDVAGMGIMLNISSADPTNKSPNVMVGACDIHDIGSHGVYAETDAAQILYNEIHRIGLDPEHVNRDQGVYSKSNNVLVHGNHISDCESNAISLRGTGTVRSNTVWNNATAGITFYNDSNMPAGQILIENNVSFDNAIFQINIAGLAKAAGFTTIIRNNTISGEKTGIYVSGYSSGAMAIVNNIIVVKGSGTSQRIIDARETIPSYTERRNRHYYTGTDAKPYYYSNGSKTFAEYKATSGGGVEASFGNPGFSNPANKNYRLTPDSTCATGSLSTSVPAYDREDRFRLSPSALGAYERPVSSDDSFASAATPSTSPSTTPTSTTPTSTAHMTKKERLKLKHQNARH